MRVYRLQTTAIRDTSIIPLPPRRLHSQEVAESVVLLDDLESSGVRDFGVRGVGEPAGGWAVHVEKYYTYHGIS